MDDAQTVPNDLAECQLLLLAAFQRAAELSRVLEATAASYGELQTTHQAALEELSALKRFGCDYAQGYHVCRPMAAVDVMAWLRTEKAAGNTGDA